MGREKISFDNRDKMVQLGMAIAFLRNMKGMSQEQLADKVNISRSHLSALEAPGIVRGCSLNVLYNISDALEISPADLINASVIPERIINEYLTEKVKNDR